MNIYGIGTDIVNVNRIKSAIKKTPAVSSQGFFN